MPSILQRIRTIAFSRQNARCIYCNELMWISEPMRFAAHQNITLKQALQFQCTAEHLSPRKDGGSTCISNIAAACRYCNWARHKRSTDLTPAQFKAFVQSRRKAGRWNTRPRGDAAQLSTQAPKLYVQSSNADDSARARKL